MILPNQFANFPDFTHVIKTTGMIFQLTSEIIFHVLIFLFMGLILLKIVVMLYLKRKSTWMKALKKFGRTKKHLLLLWIACILLQVVVATLFKIGAVMLPRVLGISFYLVVNLPMLFTRKWKPNRVTFLDHQSIRKTCLISILQVVLSMMSLSITYQAYVYLGWVLVLLLLVAGARTVPFGFFTGPGKGRVVDDKFLVVWKPLWREFISILKITSVHMNLNFSSSDFFNLGTRAKEYLNRYLDFFCNRCHISLSELKTPLSFNVVIENNSFEVFLVLRKRGFFESGEKIKSDMEDTISYLAASSATDVGYILECIKGE
ncbi:MAG: hypothetical protein ACFFCS_07840 [Candidatus Hodarchaeota archaeon]